MGAREQADDDRIRIDKWLWAARFFKTRALAAEAVQGGKVHINDSRIKPSRPVKIGDRVHIQKGQDTYEVDVLQLSGRRGSATVARTLYEETPESVAEREERQAERKLLAVSTPHAEGRPDKRSRRQWRKLTGR